MRAAFEADGRDDLRAGRIDERDAVGGRGRDPGDILDLDAGKLPVGDGLLDVRARLARARVAQEDRRLGAAQLLLVCRGIPFECLGQDRCLGRRVLELPGRGDQRRAVASVREVHEPGQVDPADSRAGREVQRVEVVGRADHDGRSVLGDVQQVHGAGHLPDRHRCDTGRGRVRADRRQVEDGDAAVVGSRDELATDRIDGQGVDPGCGDRRDQRPAPQVIGPDLRPRRDMEPLAAPAAGCGLIVGPGLDDSRSHGNPEVARGADVVLAPDHETECHPVLRQVRVRVFVDGVGQSVPPVLQELRGRPRVIDLVEVHLVRLGQTEDPQRQARHDEHGEEPEVEPVQAPATLAAQRRAAIRPDRPLAEPLAEPADHAQIGEAERSRPRGHGHLDDRLGVGVGDEAGAGRSGAGAGRDDTTTRRHDPRRRRARRPDRHGIGPPSPGADPGAGAPARRLGVDRVGLGGAFELVLQPLMRP